MYHWFGSGMWGWGLLGTLLFWGGLIAVGVIIFRLTASNWGSSFRPEQKSAREILDERFAKGEISKKEYSDMKEHLAS